LNDVEILGDVDVGKNSSTMQWDRAIGPANFRNAEYRRYENRDAVKVQTINALRGGKKRRRSTLKWPMGAYLYIFETWGRVSGREVEECKPLHSLLVTLAGPSVGRHAANDNTS
jgi:hypothetical protein